MGSVAPDVSAGTAKDALFKQGDEWSTGLFGCFDDGWIFLFGMLAPCALAVYSSAAIYDGACFCQCLVEKVKCCLNMCGCKTSDGGMCINAGIACLCSALASAMNSLFGFGFLLFPCPYCCWRAKLRGDKGITGSAITDYLMYCCLFPCAAMQDARELKAMGKAYTNSGK